MSELNIKIRKLQDNGSTFRATPESLYMGGVGSAKVDTLCFDVPEEWKGCAITLHVQRLSGTLPDPQLLDEKNRAVVDQRWTKEKQGLWMLMAVGADGYTAMTKPGRYTCYETIDRDSTTEDITPSVYEQFVALVQKETAKANQAAKNAAASAEIAKSFESTITTTGEQVQREITATADQTKKDLTATADQTKQAIDEKAKAALASIPEDYTALNESVSQVKEEKVDKPSTTDDGKIARAKAGGVEWADVGQPTDAQTESAVTKWLDKHPEATTTVQDGAITKNKIDNNFLLYIEKDYTTPQMFGAKADGITDDSNAIFAAINASKTIVFPQGVYKCTAAIDISDKNIYAERAILDFADFIGECCITSTINGTNIHGLNIKNASPSEYAVNLQYFANGCSCENLRITNSTKGIRISGSWYTSFNNIEINIVSESGTCMTIDNSRYGNPVNAIAFTNISLNGGAIGLSVQGSTVNSLVFSGIAIENQSEFGVKTENSYGNITFDGIYFEGSKNATLFNSKLYIDIGSILVRGKYNAFANDDNQIILRSRPYNPANIIFNAQQKTYCNDLGKRYYPRFLSDANVRDHYIEKQERQDNFTLHLKNSTSPLYIRLLCFGSDKSDTTTQSLDIIELFVFTDTKGKKVLPQYKNFSSRTFVKQYTISTRINGSNLEINLSNSSEYFFRSRLIIIASYFGSESTVKTLE